MYCVKKVTEGIYWIGGNDRRIALFENVYPVPRGVSYNSYLVLDEKTVLIDTVDTSVSEVFFENIEYLLNGRKLDYLVVNHMEPDHAGTMHDLVLLYPEVKIICNAKAEVMIKQYFNFNVDDKKIIVKEMDTLNTGKHNFTFIMAPMVHWPEVMMTYDSAEKILFSADAFGTFGAQNGSVFANELKFEVEYLDEFRRYYTNIVGKYGPQVQAILKKAANIEISTICPLHGPVWRKNIGRLIEKYEKWSTYTPEEDAVMIIYASVYGHTANAAEILASNLAKRGIYNIKIYDVSVTHPSVLISEAFRCSHIVIASITYNNGIFVNMETVINGLVAHNLQNRTFAIIENGTWAATAGKLIKEQLSKCKNITILEESVSLKSSLKENQISELDVLADAIYSSRSKESNIDNDKTDIDMDTMMNISYGLFVLTAKDGDKDNGCIINTVQQVTQNPTRISISLNKSNFTHSMILKTGVFNVSILTIETPFEVFKHFGFQSGGEVDKFKENNIAQRSENGLYYIKEYANAFICAKVISFEDFGTHTVFTAEVTEAKVLSTIPSVTYDYYLANIKPKIQPTKDIKKGFICKICGYIYEGDELPVDFICPVCKHGAEDFEPLK